MCGIVAVLRRRSSREIPAPQDVLALLGEATVALGAPDLASAARALAGAATHVEAADTLLRGSAGIRALIGDPATIPSVAVAVAAIEDALAHVEHTLQERGADLESLVLEDTNSAIVRLKDAAWAVRQDRLRTAAAVADLAGPHAGAAAIDGYASIQLALSALDRLEVRGRDSAGLHVLVRGHALSLDSPRVRALAGARLADPLFGSLAVRAPDGHIAFVYKAAAEIGEYGDNTRALREAIRRDALLREALAAENARATVVAHTRWASVGIISQPNAHPLNHEEVGSDDGPYCAAVLNGDVDNYADLKAQEGLRIPDEITTDAKVIPALWSRRMREGASFEEAFRRTVASFEGSVAIAAVSAAEPDKLALALRGSGQAVYVGLAEDAFVVASEPYGLVEEAKHYLRMDGEMPADPASPLATRGQILVLDESAAGTIEGVRRIAYDGTTLPVREAELVHPDVTTRDVARGDFPHYLVKEISESPQSFRKTLRGRIVERDGGLVTSLGPETLPERVVKALRSGDISRVVVIGQGTAAVAGRGMADALHVALGRPLVRVEAMTASELSGFNLRDDMSDTLVVAISQSGTSADTNRTVDLARACGAHVVSIVNRRGSDLTDKSDGVMYTSDGRDFEMAVPSTKAFYAQIAAGFILAFAIAHELGAVDAKAQDEILSALRTLPASMEEVLLRRDAIAQAARRHAPGRRSWAVVGSGPNRVAAEEVRIKLSELCYKSIACDTTEDKKHIDLSAEPLIVLCAAGLTGSNADDVAMEVARFRAHKAVPIVIASEGDERFHAAIEVLWVPHCHPALAYVLSAMAGHLFGYEAALAIDAQAHPLREARGVVESLISAGLGDHATLLDRMAPALGPAAARFNEALRAGFYDGSMEASTAVRVASILRYATKVSPLEAYPLELGKVGTPGVVLQDLTDALTRGIEELTRPVDAIKHQAKTVTVGISRSDETLLRVPVVHETIAAGASRDRLTYRTLRTLAALDPAVSEVLGFTRYRVDGDVASGAATIGVVDKGGIARDLRSRTEDSPILRGTKRRAAVEREVWVARGQSDGRPVIIVPEVKGSDTVGITLLQVGFRESLPAASMRAVLEGYKDRFGALRDAVTETEPVFRDDLLETVAPLELLTEPVYVLAATWRGT